MPTAFITLEPLAVLDERDLKTQMPVGTLMLFDIVPEPGALVYCARVGHVLGAADVDPRRYIVTYDMWAKSMMPNDKGWANVVKTMIKKLRHSFTVVGPSKGKIAERPKVVSVDDSVIVAMERVTWGQPGGMTRTCVKVTFEDPQLHKHVLTFNTPYVILSSLRHSQ